MNAQSFPQEQMPLFGGSRTRASHITRPAPLARNSDPASSHIAAREVTASGKRDSQRREILAWLRSHGTQVTSMELAHARESRSGSCRSEVSRCVQLLGYRDKQTSEAPFCFRGSGLGVGCHRFQARFVCSTIVTYPP
jgi:hypothetical protein